MRRELPGETIRQARAVDLLAMVEAATTLRKVASTRGGEWAGACPLCGGRDRFRVQPNHPEGARWFCRGCGDGRWHDAIEYMRRRHGLSFREAVARLAGATDLWVADTRLDRPPAAHPAPLRPPGPQWQAAARPFVEACERQLWSPAGARALAWLRSRQLSDATIRGARLGYNAADRWEDRATWGLPAEQNDCGRPKGVWLPRGITIPWELADQLWRVNIRRPVQPKYVGPAGSANGLYSADALNGDRTAMLVEGELDALTVAEQAGDLVAAVATGSTAGSRRPRWIARLARATLVLVAFDNDAAGEEAARYWAGVLPNARRWRPYWSDANAMAQARVDLRAWVLAALETV